MNEITSSPARCSSHTAGATTTSSHGGWAERVWLGRRLLDIHLLAVNHLLGRLQQVKDNILVVIRDETEILSLVLDSVKRHFNFNYLRGRGKAKK